MEKLRPAGLRAGYHNHQAEFKPVDGKRPIEVIAANTPKDVMLQFDVGTCVEVGNDPVAWINANPGRINSLHLKDWAPGARRTKKGLQRAIRRRRGAVAEDLRRRRRRPAAWNIYLIEQEGSRYPSMETARALPGQLQENARVAPIQAAWQGPIPPAFGLRALSLTL